MNRREFVKHGSAAAALAVAGRALAAEDAAPAATLALPPPAKTGGKPLMQALAERRSQRTFADRPLPEATLSALLWAAAGVNRPDGRRTAPTGMNVQDTDVYVLLAAGAYRYDHKAHALTLVNAGDHRALAGRQAFTHTAPVNLFYVQDQSRAMKGDAIPAALFAGVHAGAMMQNAYLFCAQEGLACVVRASFDAAALARVFGLSEGQRIVVGQTVGYP